MYSATDTVTISCAAGTDGPEVTRTATSTSIISQRDADLKAHGFASMLAYYALQCAFQGDPSVTIYYSAEASASVNNDPGYVTETFEVTLPAGSIYSTTSQADADAAAQTTAEVRARQKRDAEQRPLYENREQSASGACSADYQPYSTTVTVAAGSHTSETSQEAADSAALADAQAQLAVLLTANCHRIYYSETVSYEATCTTPGEVGDPVRVTYQAGAYTSLVSQADATATALAAATAAAVALLECSAGYYNIEQSVTLTCEGTYGPGWSGADSSVTIPAGTYHAATQDAANTLALNAAGEQASEGLSCVWDGGVMP